MILSAMINRPHEQIDPLHAPDGLLYLFEFSCGISAYMLNVNPFNQPGVETYKKNLKALMND